MSNITTRPANLPSFLAALEPAASDDLFANVQTGFPVISIRGSKWRIVRGGEETMVRIPNTEDFAPSIEVVILKANRNLSKTFYLNSFVEGSDAPPDCYSFDGISPDVGVEEPQAAKCATCKQNVWGSKISPNGNKIKACADVRRIAVAPAGELNDPHLLRVPAASLAELANYGRELAKKGIPPHGVVTKLSFDGDAAYPKLVFRAARYVTEDEWNQANATRANDLCDRICGIAGVTTVEAASDLPAKTDVTPAGAPPAHVKAEVETKAPPAAAEKVVPIDSKPAAEKKPPKGKVTVVPEGQSLSAAIDDFLGGLAS